MASVKFVSASRVYAKDAPPAVDALDLDIKDGEFMVLVGPSGFGQDHRAAHAGRAGAAGRRARRDRRAGRHLRSAQGPGHRDGVPELRPVPEQDRRGEHGLRAEDAGRPKDERARRVREAAQLLDLDDKLLDRKPKALSGGQRQRVAMGRAIVREPQVFLMDEPLSNLDAKLRVQTRSQIAELQRRLGITTVYVTHDQVEAMTMGHRVAVLAGRAFAAMRHAAPAVRQPGQPVRRRVHRLPRDEPADGAAHRGRRPAGRAPRCRCRPRFARRPARPACARSSSASGPSTCIWQTAPGSCPAR